MKYRWKIDATVRFVGRIRCNGLAMHKGGAEIAVSRKLNSFGNRLTRWTSRIEPQN